MIGVMEYWSGGVMSFPDPTTPSFSLRRHLPKL